MADIRRLFVHQHRDVYDMWVGFLNQANIRHEDNVEFVYGVFEGDQLIATGSIYQNILKCIAVCKDFTGGATLSQLISHLMSEVLDRGFKACYVYTKPDTTQSFEYLGFKEIGRVDGELVFLEKAINGFDSYLESIQQYRHEDGVSAAIVMNANPFTKGHQYLVESAAAAVDYVFVFVLSEDASAFPAAVRKQLVMAGVSHLDNVTVLDTGSYMVSSQTFPSYFLKESSDVTRIQAELDASIFKNRIAKTMNIRVRFVGEEPFSEATNIYNTALKTVLEPEVQLRIIPRKQEGDVVISATRVREHLYLNDLEFVKELVPTTTYDYLTSQAGQSLIEDIRNGGKSIGKV